MLRNKVSIERQIDERLYQFMIPSEGNWVEVLAFAQEIVAHANKQIELAKPKDAEEVPEVPKSE